VVVPLAEPPAEPDDMDPDAVEELPELQGVGADPEAVAFPVDPPMIPNFPGLAMHIWRTDSHWVWTLETSSTPSSA
jgi:hypothetical protein